MNFKRCKVCGLDKPEDRINFRSYTRNNEERFMNICRECENKRNKEYNTKHKGEIKAYHASYYLSHKTHHSEITRQNYIDNKEHILENQRLRYAIKKELIKSAHHQWYLLNKGQKLKKNKEWFAAHPYEVHHYTMVKRIKRKYRLRICQCEDLKDIINSIKTSDGIECYWCGIITKGDDITVDHYVPINKGGTHTWDNIVPACRKCNSSKGDKLPMDYIAYKLAQGECININRKDLVYEAYLNQICFCE